MIGALKTRLALAIGAATLVVGLTAGAALAGEVTGKGDPTPIQSGQANSICSFSGYNDGHPPPGRTAAHVQSWGQIPKDVRDAIAAEEHPGIACNGHSGFFAGGE